MYYILKFYLKGYINLDGSNVIQELEDDEIDLELLKEAGEIDEGIQEIVN